VVIATFVRESAGGLIGLDGHATDRIDPKRTADRCGRDRSEHLHWPGDVSQMVDAVRYEEHVHDVPGALARRIGQYISPLVRQARNSRRDADGHPEPIAGTLDRRASVHAHANRGVPALSQ
jgi:hypothetical protein